MLRRVQGDSMLPTYRSGTILLIHKYPKTLRADDVVIFEHQQIEKIKRISSMHPETIEVLGDNRLNSTDSRAFGPIHKNSLRGKVLFPRK